MPRFNLTKFLISLTTGFCTDQQMGIYCGKRPQHRAVGGRYGPCLDLYDWCSWRQTADSHLKINTDVDDTEANLKASLDHKQKCFYF